MGSWAAATIGEVDVCNGPDAGTTSEVIFDMITLRAPQPHELQAASELCLRSKAHWGYDADFMAACEVELTLSAEDLSRDMVVLAFADEEIAGVAQVSFDEDGCFLEKLFVDPSLMGKGIGRALFEWSCSAARQLGAEQMVIEADPDAVPFYLAMYCREAGFASSGSIPGRTLPRLVCDVKRSPQVD